MCQYSYRIICGEAHHTYDRLPWAAWEWAIEQAEERGLSVTLERRLITDDSILPLLTDSAGYLRVGHRVFCPWETLAHVPAEPVVIGGIIGDIEEDYMLQTIILASTKDAPITIEADTVGGLAIHPALTPAGVPHDSGRWIVTHAKTGKFIVETRNKAQAMQARRKLRDIGINWTKETFTPEEIAAVVAVVKAFEEPGL